MKKLALIITDFRTVLAALVSVAAMFPGTWSWAQELKQDAPAVRETLDALRKEQAARKAETDAQLRLIQMQLELTRETMMMLHGQGPEHGPRQTQH